MVSFPRVVVWQLLLVVALALNLMLLYSRVAPSLDGACSTQKIPIFEEAVRRAHDPWPAGNITGAFAAMQPAAGSSSRELSLEVLLKQVARSSAVAGGCGEEVEGSLGWFLCLAEASVSFHSPLPKPLVLARDVTHSRYFAQRDLQGWTMAFESFGFTVEEVHHKTVRLPDFSVFLCLGIASQDRLCLRPSSYHLLGPGQRFNQIHGIRESLWRKDGMCLTLREALATYEGPRNFTFPCWVLPTDRNEFREKVRSDPRPYIVKPNAKGEGHGIFVASTIGELDKHDLTGHVAQPLLTNPYLIQGKKFDFRTYVLVTSAAPLRAYFYHEGLVRFASRAYNSSEASRGREAQVLTNTSVGKKYTHLSNLTWTFKRLRRHLSSQGVDTHGLFNSIHEVIVRTLLSAEYRLLRDFRVSLGGYSCSHCFQLLGVDVILDSDLNPYVIEVNGLPSMQLSNDLGVLPDTTNAYTATKLGLLHNTLQILFNSSRSLARLVQRDLEALRVGLGPGPLCRPPHHVLCVDLRDLQEIVQSRREFENRGNFERIYPSPDGQKYSKLIQHLHQLVQKRFRASGFAPPRTLWQRHQLYLALEGLWSLQ